MADRIWPAMCSQKAGVGRQSTGGKNESRLGTESSRLHCRNGSGRPSLNENVPGEVIEVSSSSKNTGGQYHVKVSLSETNVPILSGMYATVKFPIAGDNQSRATLIPLEAVVQKGQLSGVYTVSESNTALLRWLRLGRTYGDKVEVLSGLAADESFIISSNGKLYNGAKISIQ